MPKPLNQKPRVSHTPGPWDWKEDSVSVFSTRGFKICDSSWAKISVSEAEANARLIAAAPKLLETLVKVMDAIEKGGVSYATIPADLRIETRSLIDSAEGRKV